MRWTANDAHRWDLLKAPLTTMALEAIPSDFLIDLVL